MPLIRNQKRAVHRLLSVIFGLLFVFAFSAFRPAHSLDSTEVLWDTYGIPHIYAQTDQDLFRAFGWSQAQSHGNLILRLYGQARGRAAEYWGEDYLTSDEWVLTMDIPRRSQMWYDTQAPAFQRNLDAFAEGVNRYVQDHPEEIEDEVKAVLPITGVDLLAHGQRVLNFTFVVDPDRVFSLLEDPTTAHKGYEPAVGSNGWAIAPSRSASSHAMLLANPHLPWSDLFLWYEAHLTTPNFDAYGATLVGIPVLAIAFNDFLGWTHTVNTHDGWDAYALTLSEDGYVFDQEVRAFETEERAIAVKQADGTVQDYPLTIRRSVHGPVIAEHDGQAIALRVVGLDHPGALEQWWDMAHATSLNEFEPILQRLQIPMFTLLYGDRDGHILNLFNGQVPIRSEGGFDDWTQLIPGDTSVTLWTENHPYTDLPRVVDPPTGWLQNANDPPWTTTLPQVIRPDDYPPYLAPSGPMDFRAQRSAQLLMADESISLEEMIAYKHSTRMELADRWLDELIPAARQLGNDLAQRAADVLDTWDRQANPESQGAILFAAWVDAAWVDAGDFFALFETPWDAEFPVTTPDGLADPSRAVAVLETVASEIETMTGSLDISWGDLFRLQVAGLDLPANGGSGNLGIFRVVDFAPTEEGQFISVAGDSYTAAIEFSTPAKAWVLNSYGNSTQPNSSHQGDQLQLFADQKLRPAWRSRLEVEAHLEKREQL